MILSCQADQYGRLDTLNIKIRPLFQILQIEIPDFPNSLRRSSSSSSMKRNSMGLDYSFLTNRIKLSGIFL